MKKAILSDIHGNLEAFQQVLMDIDRCEAEQIFCLGDSVGYGPDSESVIQIIMAMQIEMVMGNHELAITDPAYRHRLNPTALKALLLAETQLSDIARKFIKNLPQFIANGNCRYVHGFPPESINTYLFQISEDKLAKTINAIGEKYCFIGHTHELEMVVMDGTGIKHMEIKKGIVPLDPNAKYLLNIGSVGQPRDGDNHAKYAIHDDTENTLEIRFISYDIGKVVKKMEAGGYPQSLSRRLWGSA